MPLNASAGIQVMRHGDGSHSLSNLETCSSVWACPVCAAKICDGRRRELETLVAAHQAVGGLIYLLTLTIPHYLFQDLLDLRKAVTAAWRFTKQGRAWQEARDAAAWCGDVRALDLTHASAGWHPHLHVLVFFEPGASSFQAEQLGRWLRKRWTIKVERMGYGTCSVDALDFKPVRDGGAGAYCAKWGIGRELVGGAGKRGRSNSRTPWQLLEAVATDREAADLFRQYVAAFKGARQLTFSRTQRDDAGKIIRLGIRERYGLRECSDEELAAAEGDAPAEHVCTLGPCVWRTLVHHQLVERVQDLFETTGGWFAIRDALLLHGVALLVRPMLGRSGATVPLLVLKSPSGA